MVRFEIPAPDGLPVVGSPRLSPDGRYVAFRARTEAGQAGIWVRPLNGLDAQLVAGSDDARSRPFWSPDSRHIGFFVVHLLDDPPVRAAHEPHEQQDEKPSSQVSH